MSRGRVLVTGGAGYIGSHACKALTQQGYDVLTYDDLSTGHREMVKWGALAQGDMRDEARLQAVFAEFKPQAVMHFAALATLPACAKDPALCHAVNVEGTANLLRTMKQRGCADIVFSSSCAVYAQSDEPLSEATPFGPINPYGESKFAGEQMLLQADGIRAVMLRYFNAAGADPEAETGEWHEPETHALPLLIAAAYGKLPLFRLFGTDYPTPDGTAIRDYIHVSDLADAHVRALDYLQQGGATIALNVGTGQGVSVRELVQAVQNISGRSLPLEEYPRRSGDPVRLVADARRIGEVLGWHANHSGLESIVRTAVAWHEKSWQKMAS